MFKAYTEEQQKVDDIKEEVIELENNYKRQRRLLEIKLKKAQLEMEIKMLDEDERRIENAVE